MIYDKNLRLRLTITIYDFIVYDGFFYDCNMSSVFLFLLLLYYYVLSNLYSIRPYSFNFFI